MPCGLWQICLYFQAVRRLYITLATSQHLMPRLAQVLTLLFNLSFTSLASLLAFLNVYVILGAFLVNHLYLWKSHQVVAGIRIDSFNMYSLTWPSQLLDEGGRLLHLFTFTLSKAIQKYFLACGLKTELSDLVQCIQIKLLKFCSSKDTKEK